MITLLENNWKDNKNGEIYKQRISEARQSDLLWRLINTLNGEIHGVNREFQKRYKWGKIGRLKGTETKGYLKSRVGSQQSDRVPITIIQTGLRSDSKDDREVQADST